ncbi:MAG: ATP-grasp domain-containing protein [Candidatus Bathyarchaeota archaeon]|nr:MAG: ATP-grasp domain-containing protein [Candidatus Bathyarchaeota archaeon]
MSSEDIQIERLLVVGIDATSVSLSASKAGFEVFGVDYFGDIDLKRNCKVSSSLREQGILFDSRDFSSKDNMQGLARIAGKIVSEHEVDGILLASGLEDYPGIVGELQDFSDIIGNPPEAMRRARDWESLFRQMRRRGVSCPETEITKTLDEAKRAARDIGYPIVLKPSKGSGGIGISLVRTVEELEKKYPSNILGDKEMLIQEYIHGIHASASIISTDAEARVSCLTEQLIGDQKLGQREPFGWCGNIVPLDAPVEIVKESIESVKRIIEGLGVVGSNGVDFVISNSGVPYLIEVNPRFQETIECVENYLDTNIVLDHINACLRNRLPQELSGRKESWARFVLFAIRRSYVERTFADETIRNIPPPASIIDMGNPVCSIILSGKDRSSILREGYTKIEDLRKLLSTP